MLAKAKEPDMQLGIIRCMQLKNGFKKTQEVDGFINVSPQSTSAKGRRDYQ